LEKPTIFFSHSSADKEYLYILKKKILEKTSDTIEIFLSSDGESIPFGNNWIYEIEENLNNATLMFVFVSPNSIKSNWLYFESGFSYSKGVKVIPVGINSINVGDLKPPINLLQGFNIFSADGLNNIISILNKEFGCSFSTDFNDKDFEKLFNTIRIPESTFYKHIDDIDFIQFSFFPSFTDDENKIVLKNDPLKIIEEILENQDVHFAKGDEDRIYLHGMIIISQLRDKQTEIVLRIDPNSFKNHLQVITIFINELYDGEFDKFWCYIYFNNYVSLLSTDFKLSSRLHTVNINISKIHGRLFEFNDLLFSIDDLSKATWEKGNDTRLRLVFNTSKLQETQVFELIEKLFSVNVCNIVKSK